MKRLILTAFLGISVAFGADDIETLTKKCEANDGRACDILADKYKKGEGVAKDVNLAVKYYEKACNLKYSCNSLGYSYERGRGVAKDEAKAIEYYAKDCDLGNGIGCANAGTIYYTKTQRFLTAKKYFEKGCNLNNDVSCNSLGALYYRGQGVKADRATAKKYFKKACDLGHEYACQNYRKM